MRSKAQIAASKANSQKSTGPTSLEGKNKSRLNALRDGITGQVTTLSPEDRPVFEKLKAEHVADLKPETISETKLAHAIAWDTWRLDRLRATEMNIYAQSADNHYDPDDPDDPETQAARANTETFCNEARRFELMSLYETRLNRSIHRNLEDLRNLQTERRRNWERDRNDEILVARANEIKNIRHQTCEKPSPGGFLFADQDIINAATRQRILEASASLVGAISDAQRFDPTMCYTQEFFERPVEPKAPEIIEPDLRKRKALR